MVKEEVFESLKTELQASEGDLFNETLLKSKVESAYREVMSLRQYPYSYSQVTIENDIEQFYTVIRRVALFDYSQSGAEGQTSYSADGTSIHYIDRDKLFYGVIPIGGVIHEDS